MKLRLVADVTRDLLRLYTPKSEREPLPKRGRSGNKAGNRPFDFRRLRVLARHDHGDVALITVTLTASDATLAGIAIADALTLHALSPGATVARPIIEKDGEPAMVLHVQCPPNNLAVGRLVNVSAVFRLDSTFAEPAIEAVVSTIKVRRDREPGTGAPITLPTVGSRPPLADEDIGLKLNPGAQARAEAFIRAAIGYRLHLEDKARKAARLAAAVRIAPGPTVAVEVPDESVELIYPTDVLSEVDRGIYRELVRLTAPPRGSRKRPAA